MSTSTETQQVIPFSDIAACLPKTVTNQLNFFTHKNFRRAGEFSGFNGELRVVAGKCSLNDGSKGYGLFADLNPAGLYSRTQDAPLLTPGARWAKIAMVHDLEAPDAKPIIVIELQEARSENMSATVNIFRGTIEEQAPTNASLVRVAESAPSQSVVLGTLNKVACDTLKSFFSELAKISKACAATRVSCLRYQPKPSKKPAP